MNTQYVYLSDIPNNTKPVLFLHDFHNKWARMLYLENSFSGLRDAMVYNPVRNHNETVKGVERLRSRETSDSCNLSAQYVFFPPADVFLTTMIPDGASMLPYILLENLPKEASPAEIIADLPLQLTDLKPWDIAERNDKCLLIKLPLSCTFPMRSFILGTLRSRCINTFYPKVSELIISPNPVLGDVMVPRMLQINQSIKSYQSNLFYLHEVPPKITVKMIIESMKAENIKGSRVFFLELHNRHKFGFIYVPKSLPSNRFMVLFEKLRDKQFLITPSDSSNTNLKISDTKDSSSDQIPSVRSSSGRGEPKDLSMDDEEDWGDDLTAEGDTSNQETKSDVHSRLQIQDKTIIKPTTNTNAKPTQKKLKINQVWFRGEGCDPPNLEDIDGGSTSDDDVMVLTHYLYIAGVPTSISPQQLLFGCPNNLRLNLFTVNEMDTQLGFLTFPQGMDPDTCNLIIRHLRGLNFTGCNLEVNEIYIRCPDLAKVPPTRWPYQFITRMTNNMNTTNGLMNNSMLNQPPNMIGMAPGLNGANAGMQDAANAIISSLGTTSNPAIPAQQNNNNDMTRLVATLLTNMAQNSTLVQPQQQQMPNNNIATQLLTAMTGQQMVPNQDQMCQQQGFYNTGNNGSNGTSSMKPSNQKVFSMGANNDNGRKRANETSYETDWKPENVVLTQVPEDDISTMKTEFVCVENLPRNVGSAALLVSAGRASSGCVILPSSGGSNKAFMYFPDCSPEDWLVVLCNLSKKNFSGKQALIREVYLQTDNLANPNTKQVLLDSDVVFVYNIDQSAQLNDIYQFSPSMVHQAELMETSAGSKSAFIVVKSGSTETDITKFAKSIRQMNIGNKPLYADNIKLGPVDLVPGKRRRV